MEIYIHVVSHLDSDTAREILLVQHILLLATSANTTLHKTKNKTKKDSPKPKRKKEFKSLHISVLRRLYCALMVSVSFCCPEKRPVPHLQNTKEKEKFPFAVILPNVYAFVKTRN